VLTVDEIATLCTAGAMAPSGGNTQPWCVSVSSDRMRIGRRRLGVSEERERDERGGEAFLDVAGYAAYFAVGCFAENVAITANSLGLECASTCSDGAVELVFTGGHAASPHELHDSVAARVTNRRAHDGSELAEADIAPLATAADPFRVAAVSTSDRKTEIASALGSADVLRMRNRIMFADMVREICWSDRETEARQEGLDIRTLELPAATVRLLSLLRRVPSLRMLLPAGKLADTARHLVASCSHICCLHTSAPLTPDTMAAAGMAIQRLWLTATRGGLAVHPWTVSTLLLARLEVFGGAGLTERERAEVARIGRGLRGGFGLAPGDHPVFVFRLFRAAQPAARSLRLPWQSFTAIEERSDGPR
jgi:hypothetical protein